MQPQNKIEKIINLPFKEGDLLQGGTNDNGRGIKGVFDRHRYGCYFTSQAVLSG